MSVRTSVDAVIKELEAQITAAENEIGLIVAGLGPYITVSGMIVSYNRSTARDPKDAVFTDGRSAGVHVTLQYRLYGG